MIKGACKDDGAEEQDGRDAYLDDVDNKGCDGQSKCKH